jgi:transaldolase
VYQWEKFSQKEVFFGITTNSLLLQKDDVPQCNLKAYKVLAKKAFDLGYQEIHLQVWGKDAATMYRVGQEIAAIDSNRVVVKVPVTEAGIAVAALLKREKALVTSTAVYNSGQALAAIGAGADFIAPYFGRMNNAGRNGVKEVLQMNDIVKSTESTTRVLVASLASASDVTNLASQGCDTFTLTVKAAAELFHDPLTEQVIEEFEAAARKLGAYN